MKILTAQQMREIDRLTVERCGMPYATLMENAGSRVVEAIAEIYGQIEEKCFSIFCGKGNNGGDGAVIARLLRMRGAPLVQVCLFGKIAETSGEARANFEAVKRISEEEAGRGPDLPRLLFREIDSESESGAEIFDGADIVIDALFGVGLTRPADGIYAKAIEAINNYHNEAKIVSVDIPSGLSSDSAIPIGPNVKADLTVSFTAPKIGNLLPPAGESNGRLLVADIGTPEWLIEEESGSRIQLIEEDLVADWLRDSRRSEDAHKGTAGDVLLIAGSRGKTGAAALASASVLRAGAGLVTAATPRSAQDLLIAQVRPEVMTEALDETESGAIADSALDCALQLAQKRSAIAIGPGLSSSSESARKFVRQFIEKRSAPAAPIVIDADGLNALAPWPADLKGSDDLPIVITPHPGEMARLTGRSSAEITADRIGAARDFATTHQIIVVLKGNKTVIAAPNGEVFINPTGNAGMATAGSGDVLTGLSAGLIAQRPGEPVRAVVAAVYLHGLAGDIAAAQLGRRSMIATDIIENISLAILRTGGEGERGRNNQVAWI